jgi:hypothetical protein
MPGRRINSENLMADVYLGIMIAGVNALIVLGGYSVRGHVKGRGLSYDH